MCFELRTLFENCGCTLSYGFILCEGIQRYLDGDENAECTSTQQDIMLEVVTGKCHACQDEGELGEQERRHGGSGTKN